MSDLMRNITNFIYNTKSKRKHFSESFPNEKIILCDASKAVKLKRDKNPEYGKGWIVSERWSLIISDKQINAGNWIINNSDINNAELIKFKTIYGKAMVLKINTNNDEHYQFGLQYNKTLEKQDIFSIKISEQKLKLSLLSIMIRLVFFILLIYYLLEKLFLK